MQRNIELLFLSFLLNKCIDKNLENWKKSGIVALLLDTLCSHFIWRFMVYNKDGVPETDIRITKSNVTGLHTRAQTQRLVAKSCSLVVVLLHCRVQVCASTFGFDFDTQVLFLEVMCSIGQISWSNNAGLYFSYSSLSFLYRWEANVGKAETTHWDSVGS